MLLLKRHKSFIILLEGIDGSGKHTLAKALQNHLVENRSTISRSTISYQLYNIKDVQLYSFPDYNSLCGKMLKKMLKSPNPDREIIVGLFALDRQLQDTGEDSYSVIKIFDRYHVSNWAYNMDYDVNSKYLIALEEESYIPDVTFILDIDPEISFQRRPNRRDNYEKDLEKLKVVRENYLKLAHRFGFVVLDGTKTTVELLEDIMMYLFYRMNNGLTNIYHEDEVNLSDI